MAEIGHGIFRAGTEQTARRRRAFLDDLKATIPVYPFTDVTAEIVARVGADAARQGVNLPMSDLMIGATALELEFGVGTRNRRDFDRIPGLTVVSL